MDYFEVVPVDLVEIIVSFLDKKDLGYFTDEYMHNYLIDWSHVHFHRYGFYGNFDKYVKYLAAEKMKKWVPERLGKMNLDQILDIKNLDLTGLHVKSLPDEISVLKNLIVLILTDTNITILPDILWNLTSLRRLDLSNLRLFKIPSDIDKLINLEMLALSRNNLTKLPSEIGNLTKLLVLLLNVNMILHLPPEIGNLTNLKALDLSDNSLLAELPQEMDRLDKLNYLYMNQPRINKNELPPNLKRALQ